MPQYRIWDYRSVDATRNLNEMHRMIIPPGVYHGFNIEIGSVSGTGGILRLRHSANPDHYTQAGGGIAQTMLGSDLSWLSVLKTRDNITLIEAGGDLGPGQGYATLGEFGDSGSPLGVGFQSDPTGTLSRIDYVVAQYDYNQGPVPDRVRYVVLPGVAAVVPLPPFLQTNQVLLAEVLVPFNTLQGNFLNQVRVTNVARKRLDNTLIDVGDQLLSYLRPGVYYGFEPIRNPSGFGFTLTGGGLFTKEGDFVRDPNPNGGAEFDLSSLIPQTGATLVALAAINFPGVATDAPEVPQYVLVPGGASSGTYPSDLDIAANAATLLVDPRVTDQHVTVLAYLRLTPTGFLTQIQKTERISLPDELTVSDGVFYTGSSYFVGGKGLRDALSLLHGVNSLRATPLRYRVVVDGLFYLDDDLDVPSFVQLCGHKGMSVLAFSSPGFRADTSGALETSVTLGLSGPISQSQPSLPILANYELFDASLPGVEDYSRKRLLYGDPVRVWTGTQMVDGVFYYHNPTTGATKFQVMFPTGALSGNVTGSVMVQKRNTGLSQVSVEGGLLSHYATQNGVLGIVSASTAQLGYNQSLLVASLSVVTQLSDLADTVGRDVPEFYQRGVRINRLESSEGDVSFGQSNQGAVIGMVELGNTTGTLLLRGVGNRVQNCFGSLKLYGSDCLIDLVYAPAGDGWGFAVQVQTGAGSNVVLKRVGDLDYNGVVGVFNQIGATAKMLSGTGQFAGYQNGVIVPLPEELEENGYRVLLTLRDEEAVGSDFGEAPIGEHWVDGGPARTRQQFVVRNSGWSQGAGPSLSLDIPASSFTESPPGMWTALVTLDFPVIPSSVFVTGLAGASIPFGGQDDNGMQGYIVGIAGDLVAGTGSGGSSINYANGTLMVVLSAQPITTHVVWVNGPWFFDWFAIQD